MEMVGFTGTRHVTSEDYDAIRDVLDSELPPGACLVTGGCVGVDAMIAEIGQAMGHLVHTILPANRSQVDGAWQYRCTSYHEMPAQTSYRDRNLAIVAASRSLIAFPEYPEEHRKSRRSGTWQTIRLARAAGIPVTVHILREGRWTGR